MAENNSSAPLKTAEGAPVAQWQKRHPNEEGGAWQNTNRGDAMWWRDNSQGWEIRALYEAAPLAVAAQAPAAVAVSAEKLASLVEELRMLAAVQEPEYPNFQIVIEEAAKVLECATPALPATGDSSAGDLAEAVHASTYVQPVPDHCDRIVWHGQYIHLPIAQAEVQAEPVAWPKDAADVRAFFSADFISAQFASDDHVPCDEDRYTISAHDFLSAVNWWADYPHIPRGADPAPKAQPADALDAETIKKAARYDWLRSGNDYQSDGPMVVLYESEGDRGDRPYWSIASDALDASIDAAMAAAQEGGKA